MSFWQKVQRGVTQAAAEASKQTLIARKNLELGSVRGDIRRKINDLGDEALALYRQGAIQHERLAALVTEIDGLEARTAAIEAEIAAAETTGAPAAADAGTPARTPAAAAAPATTPPGAPISTPPSTPAGAPGGEPTPVTAPAATATSPQAGVTSAGEPAGAPTTQ